MMLIISVLASTVIGYRRPFASAFALRLCPCLRLCACPCLCLCACPTLKLTISGRITLQRMQEAEGVTPVLETEVGLADQDVEVAGVVETHLKVVILIELDSLSKGAMSSQSI